MAMPGRQYTQANSGYRYGFNGKENDKEVKGEGNQQDYGFRIYDPRIGRFLSTDPLTPKYPELTPYQFASNRPIDGIDMDGLEYIPYIQKFNNSGNRTFSDYVGAFDNGVIDVLNVVPSLWNSGVSTFQSVRRGSYGEDVKRDFKQVGYSLKQAAVKTWNEPLKTLTSPEALEVGVSFYVGGKMLPGGGNKGNLLIPSTASEGLMAGGEEIMGAEKFTLRSINKVKGSANCVNCSVATDSYLKGAPASALNSAPKSLSVLEKEFGAKFTHNLAINQVEKMVGQKGQMGIVFGNRGTGQVGHVFNVINQDGKINFIDGQTGKGASLTGYKNFSFLPTNK